MKYKKSHNDYWVQDQVYSAYMAGCDIVEADCVYSDGEIYLSHSWRPFNFLYYGTLENYLSRCDLIKYVILEFKESSAEFNETMFDIIRKHSKIQFLLIAKDNILNPNRKENMLDFFNVFQGSFKNMQLLEDFKKENEIEEINLYKFSINHF